MAITKKTGPRTESLSLRLEPKTKFLLDLLARVSETNITKVVEQAIREKADKTFSTFGGQFEFDWSDMWQVNEGIRKVKIVTNSRLRNFLSYEEELLFDLIKNNWQFFAISPDLRVVIEKFINVLWPDIEQYISHWENNKSEKVWATGELMLNKLRQAGLKGPDWPPKPKVPDPTPPPPRSDDFEDEIPF